MPKSNIMLPPYKEIKEIYNDLIKDRIMKLQLRAILAAVLILTIYSSVVYITQSLKGNHVRAVYGLFEDNIPKGYPDTVIKNVEVLKMKHDTVYLSKYRELRKINNNHINKADNVDIH